MKSKSWKKLALTVSLLLFIVVNILLIFHSYRLTHFSSSRTSKTKSPDKLNKSEKLSALLFGVKNPRPENLIFPTEIYTTINLKSNKNIECWEIGVKGSKGTVIIFHGYGGKKSSMLDKADKFLEKKFNVLLVDFMGSGGSEGNQTTIGYYEANEVKTAFDYLKNKGENNIVLFGTSMGAVAIMRALKKFAIRPSAINLECPFGTMYKTVEARFNNMKIPAFPLASMLLFWGSVENNFLGFAHNPEEYAHAIKCPTLLLSGAKDKNVSLEEINAIYKNLKGRKTLRIYPDAGHENYLLKYNQEWTRDVSDFLKSNGL